MLGGVLEACGLGGGSSGGGGGGGGGTGPGGKVVVVGLCTVDVVHLLDQFPEEDSDQRCKETRVQRGGNASNNCTILSQLGANCEFFGTLSKENHMTFLLEDFNKYNISTEHCVFHSNCEAPLSTVILSAETGSRTIIHANATLPELDYMDFKKLNLKNYSWIHFEGRNIPQMEMMIEYVEHWNSVHSTSGKCKRLKVSLDVEKNKPDIIEIVQFADVVFVGKDFANANNCSNMSETLRMVSKYAKEGAMIICAWGDLGAMARDSDGTTVQSPAFPPDQIVDSLGAGDTFCGTVIYSLMQEKSLEDSIFLGCQVAGAKVGQRGYDSLGKVYKKYVQ